MSSSKRPREEDSLHTYMRNFLDYDTDKLAAAGRHDVKIIADLESFCGKLQVSIAAVKKARDDEEEACKQKEKAIQDDIDEKEKAIQDEIDKKAREEKTKKRKQLVVRNAASSVKRSIKG